MDWEFRPAGLWILLCCVAALAARPQPGDDPSFRFARYYGDHMVLQRAPQRANIWGLASVGNIGSHLTLTVQGLGYKRTYDAVVKKGPTDNHAMWLVQLDPRTDPSPLVISVTLGQQTIAIKDVLFGDVWLCSGQSNMDLQVHIIFNASAVIADADNYPNLRYLDVAQHSSKQPLYDLANNAKWLVSSKKNAPTFSAVCYLYGRNIHKQYLGYPIGLVKSAVGGTAAQSWSSPAVLKKCDLPTIVATNVTGPMTFATPSVLWNGMIHPLINMTLYGVLWYQGEANSHHPESYGCLFPAMVADWRVNLHEGSLGQTHPVFPFGFVQLAPVYNDSTDIYGFPDVRWHQTADMGFVPNKKLPNVFMAVAMDTPDYTSPMHPVHTRDKQTIGQRLYLAGKAIAYNNPALRYQGPLVTSQEIDTENHRLKLVFDDSKYPIEVRTKEGFEVCCLFEEGDGTCPMNRIDGWHPAPILLYDNYTVTLDWSVCSHNMHIAGYRYAWRTTPCPYKKCAIYSVENELPMAPTIKVI